MRQQGSGLGLNRSPISSGAGAKRGSSSVGMLGLCCTRLNVVFDWTKELEDVDENVRCQAEHPRAAGNAAIDQQRSWNRNRLAQCSIAELSIS